jgi:hypothetical protein
MDLICAIPALRLAAKSATQTLIVMLTATP